MLRSLTAYVADYQHIFAGNTEDTFRVGVALAGKTMRLFADFYAADLLIASPLGLRMIIGAEGCVGCAPF